MCSTPNCLRRGVGELVRYADDGVVLCRSAVASRARPGGGAETSWRRWGCGCIRIRRRWSTCVPVGRAWIFWVVISGRACRGGCGNNGASCATTCTAGPVQTAMARVRAKVRDRTGRNRVGTDIREVIAESESDPARLGQLLSYRQRRRQVPPDRQLRRVAADPFDGQEAGPQPARRTSRSVDRKVVQRARPASPARHHPLPEGSVTMRQKIIGKPCAGKPHARIERGMGKRIRTADTAPLTTNGRSVVGDRRVNSENAS